MTSPVLSLSGVTAGYDQAPVVRALDLVVQKGEVVALLGANGAGKTTTLKAIAGMVRPTHGQIEIDGDDVAHVSPVARARMGLAYVPDNRGLFFGLTVAEHLRLKHPGEELDAEVVFEMFPNLRELQNRRTGLLSGGEQQMVAVGRALARKPKLLLLDELSFGLAPVIVERLLPIIADYAKSSGCGVLLVEQHVHLALEVADRGYVVSHGELVLSGNAKELSANNELMVSSYLGATGSAVDH